MAKIKGVEPVKLFVAMLSSDDMLFEEVAASLEPVFGRCKRAQETFPFNYTEFYNKEMGSGLLRNFLSFEKLIDPLYLADVKLITNSVEMQYADTSDGRAKRRINLDPGYIGLSKLVLASVKDRPHRIYIGKGIYSEITLYYEKKTFRPFPWSYPDYASGEYMSYLNYLRDIYTEELKKCYSEMREK